MDPFHSEIRYRRLFETIHIGILILDFKNRLITAVNPYITNLAGYSRRELVGKTISQLKLFDDTVTGKDIFEALKTRSEIIYENIRLVTKNGHIKIVEVSAHTYKEAGKMMMQCTVRDLTEKREAQQELFETNQRLEALMNSLPVGVAFSLDAEGTTIKINPYLSEKMAISAQDNVSLSTRDPGAVGRKLRYFIHGRELSAKEMPIQRAIAENRVIGPLEIAGILPNGKHIIMEAISAPVHDAQGKVVGAVAVNLDLTDRKKAEEAEKLERLVEQEKMKLDFIAEAAHELRTPLAIIRGNVELALRKKVEPEDALTAINVEVIHLTNLLSDLALLTIKETDFRRKLSTHKVDLGKLVARVAKRHQSLAHKKEISIHVRNVPQVRIVGDEYYLERLFTNLITNAISYGKEKGRIWISGSKDKKIVKMSIKDNGIGIAQKDIPQIFDRFFRADGSRSKDYGGSGLGLAIVKWITEAHEGKVSVTSKVGKGSTFVITLPLPTSTKA